MTGKEGADWSVGESSFKDRIHNGVRRSVILRKRLILRRSANGVAILVSSDIVFRKHSSAVIKFASLS